MIRLGAVLVPIFLLALACGELATPETPLPPNLEATVEAVVADVQSSPQSPGEPDTESTITARVQATVQALLEATPIPSPTPTQNASPSIAVIDPTRSSPSNPITAAAPTATRITPPTPSHTPTLTPTLASPAACSAAADGVQVSAWINGALAASTLVKSGSYNLLLEQTTGGSFGGQTITFKVGSSDAAQTVVWMHGGATELNLTAPGGGISRLAPDGSGRPPLSGGPLAQPVLPHIILGTVSVGEC